MSVALLLAFLYAIVDNISKGQQDVRFFFGVIGAMGSIETTTEADMDELAAALREML